MKTLYPILFLVILDGCQPSSGSDVSGGTFEATERIISAEVPARIIKMNVKEGQTVESGDLLFIQDTVPLWLQVQKIEAQMKAIQLKLRTAEGDLAVLWERRDYVKREIDRVTKLVEVEALPPKNLDDLHAELQVIVRQIEALKSNLSMANRSILSELGPLEAQHEIAIDQLRRCKMRALTSGTIQQIYTRDAEFAGVGKPVLRLANLNELEFKMYLTARQLSDIKIGDTVTVRQSGLAKNYEGIIVWVSSEAEFTPKNIQTADEQASLVYAAKAIVKNDGFLKAGMPGEFVISKKITK